MSISSTYQYLSKLVKSVKGSISSGDVKDRDGSLSAQQLKARQRLFGLTIRGKSVSYAYIRKNACTSWKWVFAGVSKHKYNEEQYPNILSFMGDFHALTRAEANQAEIRIAVIRDPVERVYSAFINQFVQRLDRQGEIHRHVSEMVDTGFEEMTFANFVEDYLLRATAETEDAHLWSQSSHLKGFNCNELIPMNRLYERTEQLFGRKFARTYFHRPRNTSRSLSKYEAVSSCITVGEMFARFKDSREIPSCDSIMDDRIRSLLQAKYSEDLKLYQRACESYEYECQ